MMIDAEQIKAGGIYRFAFRPAGGGKSMIRRIGKVVSVGRTHVTFKRIVQSGEEWERCRMIKVDGKPVIEETNEMIVAMKRHLHRVVPMKMSLYYGQLLDHDDPDLAKDETLRRGA